MSTNNDVKMVEANKLDSEMTLQSNPESSPYFSWKGKPQKYDGQRNFYRLAR